MTSSDQAIGDGRLRMNRRSLIRTGVGTLVLGIGTPAARVTAQHATPESPATSRSEPDVESGIQVYPPHGTKTASPYTEISFRGTSRELLGPVRVEGSKSGGHSGVMKPHGDGRGVSFLPDAPFESAETVTVAAGIPLQRGWNGVLTFHVSTPAPKAPAPAMRETRQPQAAPQVFRSRPDLHPPVIDITTESMDTASGHVFVAPKIPDGQNGVMILDEGGEIVWFSLPQIDLGQGNDFKVQEYLGQPVLTWWEGASPVGYGFGHYVICNSAYQRIAEIQVGNGFPGGDVHEFLLTPWNTALVIIYNPVRWNLAPVRGAVNGIVLDGVIQEIEIETGRVLFEWHALDHVDIEETYQAPPTAFAKPLDYFHLNSIAVDSDNSLVISARHMHAIYKIDRMTGDVIWRLNGKRSDFTMGPKTRFAFQHDARPQADGTLTLFDNHESNADIGGISRGLMLDLDLDRMRATLVREYIHPTEILSVSQGNMQLLPNGNAFVGWGSAPVFSEFGPDGDLRFNGRFPRGGMSYRAFCMPWSGLPAVPPDMAIERGTGQTLTVYASWNGATGVAAWRVMAGGSASNLYEVDTSPRSGFETAITVRTAGLLIAVQALDASGRVMGVSDVMPIGTSG